MSIPYRLWAFGLTKALDYLEQDAGTNLPKLMEWLDKYAGESLCPSYRVLFHQTLTDPDNNWNRLIRSLYDDVDSRVLKKLFENFIIHANLLDWPNTIPDAEGQAHWAVIISPTFPCHMACEGCGASIYGVRPAMEFDELDQEIEARKKAGIHFFIFNGGDPLRQEEEIIALCNKHADCVFAAFTPPDAITDTLCFDLLRVGNLFPAIRVDEHCAAAIQAANLLRQYRLPFGVACRCTAKNADRVATQAHYDSVIANGAKFCWFFTCPAFGPEAPPTPAQLEAIHQRVKYFRTREPLLTLDFWDGPSPSVAPQGGC